MFEMSLKCSWREVRVNALRIVATIGAVLAKSLQPHTLLKVISLILNNDPKVSNTKRRDKIALKIQ